MFKIIRLIIFATILALLAVWLINNNGLVVINWFGYQISTDALTACFILMFGSLMIFTFAYVLAKVLGVWGRFREKRKNSVITNPRLN